MKRCVIGILAHVDAGKTTLSEALLYLAGAVRACGRVDNGNTFLDNFSLERQRGITIFSKQAVFRLRDDTQVTLLDTPGHVDFSPEAERALDVLDMAILVISAPEGVQSHTITLWQLLKRKNIPVLVFVNKTDMPNNGKAAILDDLSSRLNGVFFDLDDPDYEAAAMGSDELLERYIENSALTQDDLRGAVLKREIFPCRFGAALRLEGVDKLMDDISAFSPERSGDNEPFGGRVFKITHDADGAKITHFKVTSGALNSRDTLRGDGWEYKVTKLRQYNGGKYVQIQTARAGDIAAVAGLERSFAGMGLGIEPDAEKPVIEPTLRCGLTLKNGCGTHTALQALRRLQQEEPSLNVEWDEGTGSISVELMGNVQAEILKSLLLERDGIDADFGEGKILYRETIAAPSEGIGHYEPLRHYAEVRLLLEPGEPSSGVVISSDCPEDALNGSWQRLILTHLHEKEFVGTLTGSPITDIRITLIGGRAHEKHTEGGDFREATYRAVRQGLMSAPPVLLEPWYEFRLELPNANVGRAMSDLDRMGAEVPVPEACGDFTRLTGAAPVAAIGNYAAELASYTRGLGRLSCVPCGYRPCSDETTERVVKERGYDPEADAANSPDSIFCSHGAGTLVKWYDVPKLAHTESPAAREKRERLLEQAERYVRLAATDDELKAIFERTYGPVKRRVGNNAKKPARHEIKEKPRPAAKRKTEGQEFVLVDGYNIIFSWAELKAIANDSLELARDRLIEILKNYQGFRQCALILVFDAYKVRGGRGSVERTGDFSVVYTKEAETADMYIERTTYDLAKKHYVRVATSDGLEQIIILGNGALRVPARVFEAEVRETESAVRRLLEKYK